jgi:putative DNA primase/helicase
MQDITMEAIPEKLAANQERGTVISDEAGIFETMAGLYNDGKANIDVMLQAHAGSTVRVDRKGREPIILHRPALSLALAVQPHIIEELSSGSKKRFRGTGVLARMLFAIPKSNIGSRSVRNTVEIPTSAQKQYAHTVKTLLQIGDLSGNDDVSNPKVMLLNPAARELWYDFAQWVEDRQGEGGEFNSIQDWTGKLPGVCLRIAGLLHLAEHLNAEMAITEQTVQKSVELCKKLIPHAQKAFGMMGVDPVIADAKFALEWIMRNAKRDEVGRLIFKQHDLHNCSRFRASTADRPLKALSVLEERNLVSISFKQDTNGRPSVHRCVSPRMFPQPGN